MSIGAAKLSKIYCDRVKLSDRGKVSMVCMNATHAGFTDDQISEALIRLAGDGRPVTADTLRIEIEGKKAPAPFGITTGTDGIVRSATGRPIRGKGWEES